MFKKILAVVVLILGAILIVNSSSNSVLASQSSRKGAEGRKVFIQYCATCHGVDAKGNGPTASALKKAPADLTRIEKVNGKFPKTKIQRIISGDDMVESHGSRDMPVWGTVLRRKSGAAFAQLDIYNLTTFIETIQQ